MKEINDKYFFDNDYWTIAVDGSGSNNNELVVAKEKWRMLSDTLLKPNKQAVTIDGKDMLLIKIVTPEQVQKLLASGKPLKRTKVASRSTYIKKADRKKFE